MQGGGRVDIKQWLSRGYWAQKDREKLEEDRAKAYSDLLGASASEGEKVQTSKTNTVEKKYVKYIDYDNRLKKQIDKLYDIKTEIETVLSEVEDSKLRTLLRMRYILFYRWGDIALEMNYDERHIYRLHKTALQSADRIYKKMSYNVSK